MVEASFQLQRNDSQEMIKVRLNYVVELGLVALMLKRIVVSDSRANMFVLYER